MRGRESSIAGQCYWCGFHGDAMVVLEERLGEEMMIKKLNGRFLIY
jgi:hypothetical protein